MICKTPLAEVKYIPALEVSVWAQRKALVAHEAKDEDPLAIMTFDFDLFRFISDFGGSWTLFVCFGHYFAAEVANLAGFSALKLDGI